MGYNVVSWLCIVVLASMAVYPAVKFCTLGRAERIAFIKNFKKGKCAIVYLAAIPLYCMGYLYDGKTPVYSLFMAVTKSVQLVVLKYDLSFALLNVNVYFRAAVYLCFTLVILNAALITLSVLHQHIWNAAKLLGFRVKKGDACVVVGNTPQSAAVYASCGCNKLLADAMTRDEQEKLYVRGIAYKAAGSYPRLTQWLQAELKRRIRKKGKLRLILNANKPETNMRMCAEWLAFLRGGVLDKDLARVTDTLEIYVFGEASYRDLYAEYEENAYGCLHYVNAERQTAADFADRFPYTAFMDARHIDYDTSLIRANVHIATAFIGFDETNRRIFSAMAAGNALFCTDGNGALVPVPAAYHVFGMGENGTADGCRYAQTFFADGKPAVDTRAYLPLPAPPAQIVRHEKDERPFVFYKDLCAVLPRGENDLSYIVISCGDDYANIDAARGIAACVKAENMAGCRIFVHVRDSKIYAAARLCLDETVCIPFGGEGDTVYDYAHIVREKFTEMAILRNYVYDIEHDMRHERVTPEERDRSRFLWYTKRSAAERAANVNACLALKSRLHLMGLTYVPKDAAGEEVSYEAYMRLYAGEDRPNVVFGADGEPQAVRYSLSFPLSRRNTLARLEHERWNACLLLDGFVPASRQEILTEKNAHGTYTNGKSYAEKRHGNLTTFAGLEEFRRITAARDGVAEEDRDVIKYDYQLLDGAWQLLRMSGYKIVQRGIA